MCRSLLDIGIGAIPRRVTAVPVVAVGHLAHGGLAVLRRVEVKGAESAW